MDTVLERTEIEPGDTVPASVELEGGATAQEIENIHFDLQTRLPGGDDEATIRSVSLDDRIEIAAHEERSIPIEINVPEWAPLTRGSVSVWLETRVEIDWATDPTDRDDLEIVPDEFCDALFEAVEELGFAVRYAELVETPYLDDRPFAQEFDFRPADGPFVGELEELEVTAVPRGDDLRVFVEIDQNDEIAEAYDMDFDEQEVSITFDRPDTDEIRRRIKSDIEQFA